MATQKISIALQGGNTDLSLGAVFAGKPPHAPNLIPKNQMNGPNWSIDLDPGDYHFDCIVWGPAGPCGPVVVTGPDGTQLTSVQGQIPGQAGTFGRTIIDVPFTVPVAGGSQ